MNFTSVIICDSIWNGIQYWYTALSNIVYEESYDRPQVLRIPNFGQTQDPGEYNHEDDISKPIAQPW